MNNKLLFQLSFGSISVATVMWFNILFGTSGRMGFTPFIRDLGFSFGMILFAVGILQLHKSAKIPSIILITGSTLSFIFTNIVEMTGGISSAIINHGFRSYHLYINILSEYLPIIFFLILILKYIDDKQLKIQRFISIFGVGISLIVSLVISIFSTINPGLLFGEYGRTWFADGLYYLWFFGYCGGLLMAVGTFSFLIAQSSEKINGQATSQTAKKTLGIVFFVIIPLTLYFFGVKIISLILSLDTSSGSAHLVEPMVFAFLAIGIFIAYYLGFQKIRYFKEMKMIKPRRIYYICMSLIVSIHLGITFMPYNLQYYWNDAVHALTGVSKDKSPSSSYSREKECLCCGKKFSHRGYKLGYGKDSFGVNSKIGVQPGPYDSESCAFVCEHMNGLAK